MREGILHNRPLAALSLSFTVGLLIRSFTKGTVGLLPGLLSVIFLLLLPLARFLPLRVRPSGRRTLLLALLAAALLVGSLLGSANIAYFDTFSECGENSVSLTVHVDEVVYAGNYSTALRGEVLTLDGERKSGRIELEIDAPAAAEAGDEISFDARILPVHDTRVGSDAIFLMADGVAAVATDVENFQVTRSDPNLLDRFRAGVDRMRKSLSARLTENIEGDAGGLLSAMLLGERSELAPTVRRDMTRLGLSHILAVSGLHLGIIVGFLHLFLRRLHVGRKYAAAIEIASVLFYMTLTGFPLSVVRAGTMLILALLSFYVAREPDGITSLFFAAVLICAVSRFSVYDYGLWLSVAATFGILLIGELFPWKENEEGGWLRRLGRNAGKAAAVSLGAILATLPLSALFFSEFSLLSLPANLVLAPLFSAYLLLGIPALLLAPLAPFSVCVEFLGGALISSVSYPASWRGIMVSLNRPGIAGVLAVTAILCLILLCSPLKKRFAAAVGGGGLLLAILLCSVLGTASLGRDLTYYSTDGKNDSLLIVSDGKGLLCDMSNTAYAAMSDGFSLLEDAALTEAEGYLLTHYHARHPDSFAKLAARNMIRTLYLPTPTSEAEEAIYRRMCDAAEAAGIQTVRFDPFEEIAFGRLTVIPHRKGKTDSTHPTVGLTVKEAGEFRLTYLGSAAHEGGGALDAASAVNFSPILIFGTHGPAEKSKIGFRSFSEKLAAVIVPRGEERLPSEWLDAFRGRISLFTDTDAVRIDLDATKAESA